MFRRGRGIAPMQLPTPLPEAFPGMGTAQPPFPGYSKAETNHPHHTMAITVINYIKSLIGILSLSSLLGGSITSSKEQGTGSHQLLPYLLQGAEHVTHLPTARGCFSTNTPTPGPQKRRLLLPHGSAYDCPCPARAPCGPQDTHLPDAGLLPIHHRHAAHFVGLDELPLRPVELLRHKAHEGVVRGVSCGHQGRRPVAGQMFSRIPSKLRAQPHRSLGAEKSPAPEHCWSSEGKRHGSPPKQLIRTGESDV